MLYCVGEIFLVVLVVVGKFGVVGLLYYLDVVWCVGCVCVDGYWWSGMYLLWR